MSEAGAMPKDRILIVDDAPDIRSLLSIYFTAQGYEVFSAMRGQTALDIIRKQPVNLALLDVNLPDMEGYDIGLAMRQTMQTRHIPIVFLTARGEKRDRLRGLSEVGAEYYLLKPFDIEEVHTVVKAVLERSRQKGGLHPVTGLPLFHFILRDSAFLNRPDWALARLRIKYYDSFVKAYGPTGAGEPLRYIARLANEIMYEMGGIGDFVAQVYMYDDFIVGSSQASIDGSIARLKSTSREGLKLYYNDRDRKIGSITLPSDDGLSEIRVPLMELDAQIITSKDVSADVHDIEEALSIGLPQYERHRTGALGLSMLEQCGIEYLALRGDTALLAVSIADAPDPREFFRERALAIPYARQKLALDDASLLAFVPAGQLEAAVDGMIEHFYAHHLALTSGARLTFGVASGPCASGEELLAALARDHIERYESQTGRPLLDPPIFRLEPERAGLQRRYEQLCYRRDAYRSELLERTDAAEHAAQVAIDQLIAVVNHDLTNGLNGCKEMLHQVEEALERIAPDLQRLLDETHINLTICRALQRSTAELGTGGLAHPAVRSLGGWLRAAAAIWQGFFGQRLRIELDEPPEQSDALFDDGLTQVAMLNLLLAAQEAGASALRLSLRATGPQVALLATDDGAPEPRATALAHLESVGAESGLVPLRLLQRAAQAQDVAVRRAPAEQGFAVAFEFPAPPRQRPPILTLGALRGACEQVEQEVQRLQVQVEAVRAIEPAREEQIQPLLSPYLNLLGQQLGRLVDQSRALERSIGGETAHHLSGLALYCSLLVRNLTLALKGETLPAAPSDPNEEIRQVLALLEHKIDPERIALQLDLAPELPRATVTSIELKQVLMNLIKNAVEAMQNQGTLTIRTFQAQDSVIIQVQDSGKGIPSKYRGQIFQLNFSTKGQGSNSGVGLYAVSSLVERVGGELRVASVTRAVSGRLRAWECGFGAGEVRSPSAAARLARRQGLAGRGAPPKLILTEPGTVFQVVLPIAKDERL
jgi:signal transduction histidine kinase/ActR/RegA family two-component response regulator